ncbi:hypothetical protein [Streptomyces sp. NPDC056817]|uniref:hypothetical protein n=1 Tax=Streptomyces sp. NPDC056817 TaxID=3345950 RepID=UPI0036B3C3FD
MGYDLAVWEGERPTGDKTAGQVFNDLRLIDAEVDQPPTERIAAYVAALLERWCDLTEDEDDPRPGRPPVDRRGQGSADLLPDAMEHG